METVIIILIVGAFIQSFLHSTRGIIHDFEKLFGGFYSICFIVLTIYSIIKYGIICLLVMPLTFYASNLIFSIIFDKLFNKRKKSIKSNNKEEKDIKKLLGTIIQNLAQDNYSYEFVNGGYSYSSEITDIFKVLNDERLKKVYDENISNYDSKAKKELIQKKDPLTFTFVESVIYVNWLWHLESGMATGIILKRIEDLKYLYALKIMYDSID